LVKVKVKIGSGIKGPYSEPNYVLPSSVAGRQSCLWEINFAIGFRTLSALLVDVARETEQNDRPDIGIGNQPADYGLQDSTITSILLVLV
jgi:hypothetical protein